MRIRKNMIDRMQRDQPPLTLVYLDLDNFKFVNDHFGHPIGDEILIRVTQFIQSHLRNIDLVARLGGDEFAIILSNTNAGAARIVMGKLHAGLLQQMEQNNWPITFNIGVVICNTTPENSGELIKEVDALMHSVKSSSKNAIQYGSHQN